MPSFRWPDVANAVALGTEVTSHRPQKPADWDTNSQYTKQSKVFSTTEKSVQLKVRGTRRARFHYMKRSPSCYPRTA